MFTQQADTFALNNFEGPLDFLLSLIHKEEIDIYDVSIQELTQQFLCQLTQWQEQQVDKGAEFIGVTAYLVWLKSKMLLPKHEDPAPLGEEEEDPHFEIIHHLIDYCRFKQAAKELVARQEQQRDCFFRGTPPLPDGKKPLGIHHLSLNELAELFKEMMSRAPLSRPQIYEDHWKVSDKITLIRSLIQEQSFFPLENLFLNPEKTRIECIILFLALLELMKMGEMAIGRQEDRIFLFAK